MTNVSPWPTTGSDQASGPLPVVCYSRRKRYSGRPAPTASSKAWSSAGGGRADQARQQRPSRCHGASQPRTWRTVTGHDTGPPRPWSPLACSAPIFPPPRRDGHGQGGGSRRNRRVPQGGRGLLPRLGLEPGPPAKGKGTADEVPMPLDRRVRPHLKVGPAEFAFHLFVPLLDPQPQAIEPDDFRQVGWGEWERRGAWRARARQIRQQIPGAQRRQGARVRGGDDQPVPALRAPAT